ARPAGTGSAPAGGGARRRSRRARVPAKSPTRTTGTWCRSCRTRPRAVPRWSSSTPTTWARDRWRGCFCRGGCPSASTPAGRRRMPDGFDRWALVHVFLFQGLMLLVVSLPVQVGGYEQHARVLGPAAALGLLLWAVGLTFESVGDAQLVRFKADPANSGQVMD